MENEDGPMLKPEDTPTRRQTIMLRTLMQLYADQGRRVVDIAHLTGRSVATMKKHARIAGIVFADYTPRSLR